MASQSLAYPGGLARQAPAYRAYPPSYSSATHAAAHCSPNYSITYPDYTGGKSELESRYSRQTPACTVPPQPQYLPPPPPAHARYRHPPPRPSPTAVTQPTYVHGGRSQVGTGVHHSPLSATAATTPALPASPRPAHATSPTPPTNHVPHTSRHAPSCTCRPSPRHCRACGSQGGRHHAGGTWGARPPSTGRVPTRSSSFSSRRSGGLCPPPADDEGALSDTYLAVRLSGRRQAPGFLSDREDGGERVSWAPEVNGDRLRPAPGSPRSRPPRPRRTSDSTVRPTDQQQHRQQQQSQQQQEQQRGSGYDSEGEQPTIWGLGGPGDQQRAWGLGSKGGVELRHARFLLDYGFTKVTSPSPPSPTQVVISYLMIHSL